MNRQVSAPGRGINYKQQLLIKLLGQSPRLGRFDGNLAPQPPRLEGGGLSLAISFTRSMSAGSSSHGYSFTTRRPERAAAVHWRASADANTSACHTSALAT